MLSIDYKKLSNSYHGAPTELVDMMEDIFRYSGTQEREAVCVSGPRGHGKTTILVVLSSYLASTGKCLIWVHPTSNMKDVARLFNAPHWMNGRRSYMFVYERDEGSTKYGHSQTAVLARECPYLLDVELRVRIWTEDGTTRISVGNATYQVRLEALRAWASQIVKKRRLKNLYDIFGSSTNKSTLDTWLDSTRKLSLSDRLCPIRFSLSWNNDHMILRKDGLL